MEMSQSDSSWPEAVGLKWNEVEKMILDKHPKITIQVLPQDSMVTMDYNTDRVRIFIDEEGKVVRPPRIG